MRKHEIITWFRGIWRIVKIVIVKHFWYKVQNTCSKCVLISQSCQIIALLLFYLYSFNLLFGAVWIKILRLQLSVHLSRGRRTCIWRQNPTPLCSDVSLMSMNLIRGPALLRFFVNDMMQPSASKHAGCFHCMRARSWHIMSSPMPCPSCPDLWWWLIKISLYLVECLHNVGSSWLTPGKKVPCMRV